MSEPVIAFVRQVKCVRIQIVRFRIAYSSVKEDYTSDNQSISILAR